MLHERDSTLLELTEYFPISFQAVSTPVKILEEAQLVNKVVKGKYRLLSLNHAAFKLPMEWISYHSRFWNESLDRLDQAIKQGKAK